MSIIKIDMARAREIHKTNIRNARSPKLAELDVEFTKALETGASTTDIVAKKQAINNDYAFVALSGNVTGTTTSARAINNLSLIHI